MISLHLHVSAQTESSKPHTVTPFRFILSYNGSAPQASQHAAPARTQIILFDRMTRKRHTPMFTRQRYNYHNLGVRWVTMSDYYIPIKGTLPPRTHGRAGEHTTCKHKQSSQLFYRHDRDGASFPVQISREGDDASQKAGVVLTLILQSNT